MAETGKWYKHTFEVSDSVIRGFSGLQIKSSSEVAEKNAKKQKYVVRKNGKPFEVSMTVTLHAGLGNDVRTEAMAFLEEARTGASDYFYVGEEKLLPYKLILADATVKDCEISPTGQWVKAVVTLTMKQSQKATDKKKKSGKNRRRKASVRSSSYKIGGTNANRVNYILNQYSNGNTYRSSTAKITYSYRGSGGGGKKISYIAHK